jgi:CubicO group peptidase (beta-lactamase class C family)
MSHPTQPPSGIASTVNQRERFSAAYAVLEQAVGEGAFPGAAFGILLEGQILALDGVGRFTYAPESAAVAADTIYDLASVTKVAATTAAAMLLYDRGRLDLDRPLGDILPGFVIGSVRDDCSGSAITSPVSRCRVTLRNLLSHSSGLPAYARLFETNRDATSLLNACMHMPLEAPPNTRSEYSDIGFILLGKAIELLSQQPLHSFCAREVFAPLGMAATCYKPPPSWRERIPPTVEDTTFRLRLIQGEVHDENCSVLGGVSGHAGVFSNVPDLLAFAACILADGKTPSGRQLFESKTVDLFAARQDRPPGTSRALGWDTPSAESSSGHYFSPNSVGHLGYAGTSLWIDRDRSLAVVLLANRTWPDRSSQTIRSVRPAFHDAVRCALTFT